MARKCTEAQLNEFQPTKGRITAHGIEPAKLDEGHVAEVSCLTGYVLSPGSPILKCECKTDPVSQVVSCDYGDGIKHTCRNQCDLPSLPTDAVAYLTDTKSAYDQGTKVTLACGPEKRVTSVELKCKSSDYQWHEDSFQCEAKISDLKVIYKEHPEYIFIPVAIFILLLILFILFLILFICAKLKSSRHPQDAEDQPKKKPKKKFQSVAVQNEAYDGVGRVLIFAPLGATRFDWRNAEDVKSRLSDPARNEVPYLENRRQEREEPRDSLVLENGSRRHLPIDQYHNSYASPDDLRAVATPQVVPRRLTLGNAEHNIEDEF